MTSTIVEELEPGIVLVKLNRPNRLNALTAADIASLTRDLRAIDADSSVRVVVMTGEGRGFCAGLDLDDLDALNPDTSSVQDAHDFQEDIAGLVATVVGLRQPVVAAINGPAVGAGLGLAIAADVRVCSPSAGFGAAFIRLGISGCDVGVSYLLPRIVGSALAFEMMLTGRVVDATEAHSAGLVSRIASEDELFDNALEMARHIASHSPFAVEMTKKVMHANLAAPSLHSAMELENRTQMLALQTRDHREALQAFREGRRPRFGGS